MATTLRDVANEAGVTVMAASVVLNGATSTARVSEATRSRIIEAAARLRYRRNAVALGLSRSRMDTIGAVTTMVGSALNMYYQEVMTGILATAAELGQSTTIITIKDWKRDESRIIEFCDGRIDGVILIGPELDASFVTLLAHHAPAVALHGTIGSESIPNLDVDNEEGSYQVTKHLIDLGHRRLVHLTGPLNTLSGGGRLAGFKRALEEAGIPFHSGLTLQCDFNAESGYARGLEICNRSGWADYPTAIVCANDSIAVGCINALRTLGVSVPDDISITGFDDTLLASITRPRLTTVHQAFREMSRRATSLLLEEIDQDRIDSNGRTPRVDSIIQKRYPIEIFPGNLVIGQSSAPPRSQ